jgi:glycosyltransferase involved in cell wall biosynthesis
MTNPKIIACIPAFNEERTIAKVVLCAQRSANPVMVCDDGSTDMTGEIADKLGAIVLRHEKNLGKGEALKTLFAAALRLEPDVVVTLDADGQHDPAWIPMLASPVLNAEADMVVGSRFIKGGSADIPAFRMIGTKAINLLSGDQVKDVQSGFRAFSKKALGVLSECESKGYGIEQEQVSLAIKSNLRIAEVPIAVRYGGLERTSKKGPVSHGTELISDALRIIVEARPLLLLGLPGIISLIIGLGLSAYLVWDFNVTRYFSVPMALIALGAIFTGMILVIAALILYALNRIAGRLLRIGHFE